MLGILAVVVLGGASSVLALEACAENNPAQPVPATAPTTGASGGSSAPKPTATPPAPSPTPPLPPPPT
jgi:hypothetical protein